MSFITEGFTGFTGYFFFITSGTEVMKEIKSILLILSEIDL